MNVPTISWEMSSYIILLFLLWVIIRYFANTLMETLHSYLPSLGDASENGILKVDPWLHGVHYPISYWTERGGRPYQEDRFQVSKGIVEEDSSLFGVYDGHAGYKAAQYCKEHLFDRLLSDPDFSKLPATSLKRTFNKINSEFSAIARSKLLSDGTTVVVAVVHGNRITVANAGDSRCIIVQKGGRSRHMSVDHKPNREDEERRIRSLGGDVTHWGRWRVMGILAVSRGIGDVSLQPYVSSEAEIMEKEITADDLFLVLASDGIWDVMSNDTVARYLYNHSDFLNSAKELCNEAMLLGSGDNVTAIVVDLRKRKKPVTTSNAATVKSDSSGGRSQNNLTSNASMKLD